MYMKFSADIIFSFLPVFILCGLFPAKWGESAENTAGLNFYIFYTVAKVLHFV